MMTTVGAYEAKAHLADLLKRVGAGEHTTTARRGRPVAVLVPAWEHLWRGPVAAVAALKESARETGLSVYDACYLELAARSGIRLATLDRRLAATAVRVGASLCG
jgi:prevent-host-death family protein